ncbi:MAG: hypothetical protein E7361_03970 [Clostridiales bacterium]|nr:hypothetical protein [Clostridiales bacterium]
MAKSKMSTGKIVLSVIAMLVGVAACIALFTNVWNFAITIGEKTSTEALGGYFEDYSFYANGFKNAEVAFFEWASVVAGIAVIVALVGAVAYIIGTVVAIANGGNKITAKLAKFGAIIMLIAGIVALITSIMFAAPAVTESIMSGSMAFGIGAWIGVIAPIAAGLLGVVSTK